MATAAANGRQTSFQLITQVLSADGAGSLGVFDGGAPGNSTLGARRRDNLSLMADG